MVDNGIAPEIIVDVDHIGKKYCRNLRHSLLYGISDILREARGSDLSQTDLRPNEFWALEDVSFQLERGKGVGIIGKNGSGKTSILRLIVGLIKPTRGTITVHGRIAPLLALGAGFNPVLTGRENVHLNLSILGLTTKKIEAVYEEVLDFSDIKDALDAPVRSYSSGMVARLGFACAAHSGADILIVDEGLAVGDIMFKDKCFRKIGELAEQGTSFVLVSHNPHLIIAACQTTIFLSKGKVARIGETEQVLKRYEEEIWLGEDREAFGELKIQADTRENSYGARFSSVYFRNPDGEKVDAPVTGKHVKLCSQFEVHEEIEDANLTLVFRDLHSDGRVALILSNSRDEVPLTLKPGNAEIQLSLEPLGLKTSLYTVELKLRKGGLYVVDEVASFKFIVKSDKHMMQESYYQPRHWTVSELGTA